MGVRVAIDGFGTRDSTFTYLRRFSVDTLKVRSIVRA
jgi:EAL domain-containing protein (putative c-di-GMP-specific phosphodiesterase class I)